MLNRKQTIRAPIAALVALGLLVATTPLTLAAPVPSVGLTESCTVSDTSVRECNFICKKGATITVSATNENEWEDQQFTASCGGGYAVCHADPDDNCEASDTTSSADTGTCKMEADGEGLATCTSEGGEDPGGEDPICIGGIACVCPSGSCSEIPTVPDVDIMDIVCRVSTAVADVSSTVDDGSGDLSLPQHPDPGVDLNAVDADLEELNVPDIAKLIPPCVA